MVQAGDTVTDAYANALADIGVRVQGAKFAAEQSANRSRPTPRKPRPASRA